MELNVHGACLAALLIVGSGVVSSGFYLGRDTGPAPEAFGPAAAALRAQHRPSDLILLVPHYATRAREHLGDLHPIASRDPLSEDLLGHPRVWVFGLFGEAEALRDSFSGAGLKLVDRLEPAPGIAVDLYEVPGAASVGYRFSDNLRSAQVFHALGNGERIACDAWSDGSGHGKWTCPTDGDWFYVSTEWHRVGGHPRLCIWAHPPSDGELSIRFPEVPLSTELYGRAGHTVTGLMSAQAPVFLDVTVGDQAPARFEFDVVDDYRPFALKVPPGRSAVTFSVSTPNNGRNHFCFEADLRTP